MKLSIAATTVRSVTVELVNESCYQMKEPVSLFLNEKEILQTAKNVVTIHGLHPGTQYTLSIAGEEKIFVTKEESFLLNVLQFGAVGDGKHNDTVALQAAILACPKNGTVAVPRGEYLTGPVFLKSEMTLWLQEGAVLLGDTDRNHYPVLPGMTRNWEKGTEYDLGTWEGNPLDMYASLVTAIDCHDVDVIGPGTLDGNAPNGDWWENPKERIGAWRPNTLYIVRSENMTFQDITVKNSPSWTVHPYYSRHLQFINMHIQNPYHSPNTDGFDPESCEDILLLGSDISVGDDCVAVKSGKYYMGSVHQKASSGIEIRNCLLAKGHGSITIGSEIAGGVNGIHVKNCLFRETDRGVRIKTRRGRGKQSVLTDIVIENVEMDGVHMPLTANMFYFCDPDGHSEYVQNQAYREPDEMTPTIGEITLRNIRCKKMTASFIAVAGLMESPIQKIVLEDIDAEFAPESEREPEVPMMMDKMEKMSGRGLYLQNVADVQIRNVTVRGGVDKEPVLVGNTNITAEGLYFQ